MRGSKQS